MYYDEYDQPDRRHDERVERSLKRSRIRVVLMMLCELFIAIPLMVIGVKLKAGLVFIFGLIIGVFSLVYLLMHRENIKNLTK